MFETCLTKRDDVWSGTIVIHKYLNCHERKKWMEQLKSIFGCIVGGPLLAFFSFFLP